MYPPNGGVWINGEGESGRCPTAQLTGREVAMNLAKRLAVAVGALLALVLAGGAHLKL
jgi:hypothetical protein